MKIIQANCRAQLTAADLDFIVSVLGPKRGASDALVRLLSDPDTRDAVLDDDQLFHAILERHDCLTISNHLYFYVLVRRVLRKAGIEDRLVADYVAEMLVAFSSARRTRQPIASIEQPLDYLVDMVAALQDADDRERFLLRAHMGNVSLFLAGVFPKHLHHRTERRAAPDLSYYENLGRVSFHVAGSHRLAKRYELRQPLLTLSEAFRTARLALNDLADRLLDFGPAAEAPQALVG